MQRKVKQKLAVILFDLQIEIVMLIKICSLTSQKDNNQPKNNQKR